MEFQKLTVYSHEEDTTQDRRVTLSPANIVLVAAKIDNVHIHGRTLIPVTILFLDGENIDLNVSHSDLESLEAAVGSYCLG